MKTRQINGTTVEILDDEPEAVLVYDERRGLWQLVNAGHPNYFAGITWGEFNKSTEGGSRMTFFQRKMDLRTT